MPFANAGGGISVCFQHGCHGAAGGGDDGAGVAVEYTAFEAGTPVVAVVETPEAPAAVEVDADVE